MMIRVIAYMVPHGDESHMRELGKIEIWNTGSGDDLTGDYEGRLYAEYIQGRIGKVTDFKRQSQSVWSLVGAFLKLWGHTKHSPKCMY